MSPRQVLAPARDHYPVTRPTPPEIAAIPDKLRFGVNGHSPAHEMLFTAAALGAGLTHTCAEDWPTDFLDVVDAELEFELTHCQERTSHGLARIGDGLAQVTISDGVAYVTVAARHPDGLDALIAAVREGIPPRIPERGEERVAFRVWREGDYGENDVQVRALEMPRWHEIAANYPGAAGERLGRLVDLDPPNEVAGRVLVWHGPPGTGKTYALRALAREWSAGATSTSSPTPSASSPGRATWTRSSPTALRSAAGD